MAWPSKTTSCSTSQASISDSSSAQPSPSLESSTRCWSFKSLTWSGISVLVRRSAPPLLAGGDPAVGYGALEQGGKDDLCLGAGDARGLADSLQCLLEVLRVCGTDVKDRAGGARDRVGALHLWV